MSFVLAFVVGGLICVIGQLWMDLTRSSITPAHILVGFVIGGAILSALGLYQPLVDLAGAIAGGIEATAFGVAVAVIFGYIIAVLFNPRD